MSGSGSGASSSLSCVKEESYDLSGIILSSFHFPCRSMKSDTSDDMMCVFSKTGQLSRTVEVFKTIKLTIKNTLILSSGICTNNNLNDDTCGFKIIQDVLGAGKD